jgi:hypothetical protein
MHLDPRRQQLVMTPNNHSKVDLWLTISEIRGPLRLHLERMARRRMKERREHHQSMHIHGEVEVQVQGGISVIDGHKRSGLLCSALLSISSS